MPWIRQEPEDFQVQEELLHEPCGQGPHTYLLVEKRGIATDRLIGNLARTLERPRRDIGYAGRKDRHAVTRQWLSVANVAPERALALQLDQARVLRAIAHDEKLRLGRLRGNHFQLRVRAVTAAEGELAQERLHQLGTEGIANRFGEQRFGNTGRNAELGAAILRGGKVRGDRQRARFLVSALQSAVFNELLRLRGPAVHQLWVGDLAIEHASDDYLRVSQPEQLEARLRNYEISPTGPIFGVKMPRPTGEPAQLEQAAMEAFDIPDPRTLKLPRGIALYGSRRALRVRPQELRWELRGETLELSFFLPAGSYATVLLEETFPGGVSSAAAGPRQPST